MVYWALPMHDEVIKWKHFPRLLAICAGNSPVTGEFPAQRPVTRRFEVFFDLNKRLSKQWWCWWFETPSHPLWRHCNGSCHQMNANGCHWWGVNALSPTWCHTMTLMVTYCQLDLLEQISANCWFLSWNIIRKYRLKNVGHFASVSMS